MFLKTVLRFDINLSFIRNWTLITPVVPEVLLTSVTFELTHEVMALIALRKFNLQTRMRNNPLGQHIWFLVRPLVYFHTLCVRTVKVLATLCRWAISPESSLFTYAISTIISLAGLFIVISFATRSLRILPDASLVNHMYLSWLLPYKVYAGY